MALYTNGTDGIKPPFLKGGGTRSVTEGLTSVNRVSLGGATIDLRKLNGEPGYFGTFCANYRCAHARKVV